MPKLGPLHSCIHEVSQGFFFFFFFFWTELRIVCVKAQLGVCQSLCFVTIGLMDSQAKAARRAILERF